MSLVCFGFTFSVQFPVIGNICKVVAPVVLTGLLKRSGPDKFVNTLFLSFMREWSEALFGRKAVPFTTR